MRLVGIVCRFGCGGNAQTQMRWSGGGGGVHGVVGGGCLTGWVRGGLEVGRMLVVVSSLGCIHFS
jgi:hypothetical protein